MEIRYNIFKGNTIPKKIDVIDLFGSINYFSKVCWTVPVKNENAQTLTNFFEKILKSSNAIFLMKAVLKYTGARLDIISDGELKFLLENNMRGGPSS